MFEDIKYWIDCKKGWIKLALVIALLVGVFKWRNRCVAAYERQKDPETILLGVRFGLKNTPTEYSYINKRELSRKERRMGSIKAIKKFSVHYDNGVPEVKVERALVKDNKVISIKKVKQNLPFKELELDIVKPMILFSVPDTVDFKGKFRTVEPEKSVSRDIDKDGVLTYMRKKGCQGRVKGTFDFQSGKMTIKIYIDSLSVYQLNNKNITVKYIAENEFELIE